MSNSSEVSLPVTISGTNIVYENQGSTTPGELRSIIFDMPVNYLGTYTIKASATLESSVARRLLSEQNDE